MKSILVPLSAALALFICSSKAFAQETATATATATIVTPIAITKTTDMQLWRNTGFMERSLADVDTFIALSEFSRNKHREFGFPRDMFLLAAET